ncbi:MAG: MipA/OmpV family protein [Elsteraceae bacterium]
MLSRILFASGLTLISINDALAADPAAAKSGWSFSLGGGGGFGPKYEGSKKLEAGPTVIANAQWRSTGEWGTTVFAGLDRGVGVAFGKEDSVTFGALLSTVNERRERDDSRLRGLGDVKLAAAGGVFVEVPVGPVSFRVDTQSALSGKAGTAVNFGFGSSYPVTERLSIGASLGAAWADAEHMSTYFSITRAQAARSQAGLKRFDAKAGFKSVTFGVDATYAFTPAWRLNLSAGVSNLIGDAARSPISERDLQPSVSLTLVRTF